MAVGAIPPLQILSELIIKERRGIRTWLLETGTTTGHFLLLTFIRFISGLPKISERRAAARRSPSEAPRPRSEARTRWKRRRESEVFPWHPAVSASRESSEPRSRNQARQASCAASGYGFQNKIARVEANRKMGVFKRLQELGNTTQSSQSRVYFQYNRKLPEMFI